MQRQGSDSRLQFLIPSANQKLSSQSSLKRKWEHDATTKLRSGPFSVSAVCWVLCQNIDALLCFTVGRMFKACGSELVFYGGFLLFPKSWNVLLKRYFSSTCENMFDQKTWNEHTRTIYKAMRLNLKLNVLFLSFHHSTNYGQSLDYECICIN